MAVLIALLCLWCLLAGTPQSQSKTLNSAQSIQSQICCHQPEKRRYLLCWFFLPTQLVIHDRITQFLDHINCSQPLEPCLTSCLDVYKKAMKFHTPPSGSSRTIHPENRTGYAKDWVWKYCQSCRAGRESWHLLYRLTGGVGKVF